MKELNKLYLKKHQLMFPVYFWVQLILRKIYNNFIPKKYRLNYKQYENFRYSLIYFSLFSLVIAFIGFVLGYIYNWTSIRDFAISQILTMVVAIGGYKFFRRFQFYLNFLWSRLRGDNIVKSIHDVDTAILEVLETLTVEDLTIKKDSNLWLLKKLEYQADKSFQYKLYNFNLNKYKKRVKLLIRDLQ